MVDGGKRATEMPSPVRSFIEARTKDAVFVVGPDYRIVYWDYRAESLTGILSENVVGKPCSEALRGECEGGDSLSDHLDSVMRLAQEGQPAPSYDMHVFTRSGGRRWVNVSVLSVDSEEGPYLVHLMRDSQEAHEMLELARGLIRLSSKKEPTARRDVPVLTARQLEVLRMLSEGKGVKEMGEELYLSQATIRNHVRGLLQSLRAHTQLEALAKARELGLLSS